MQSLNDDERKKILGEVLADELKAITEYVKDVPSLKRDIQEIKQSVHNLESDMKIVKAAVTDISHEQREHDRRITHLENA